MANSPKIFAHHLADLRGSAIDDETIDAAGVYTEQSPARIAELLGWRKPAKNLGPVLVFPYSQTDGTRSGFVVVKPDTPRRRGDKTIKYESPLRRGLRAYFSPMFRDVLADLSRPTIFTEGQKKILSADSAGFPGIGIAGPWGWQQKRQKGEEGQGKGPRKLIGDLAGIEWKGRTVVLIFDTDPRRNPSVNYGVAELTRALTEHGAVVHRISLPAGDSDSDGMPQKMGLDDYLLKHGAGPFRKLVECQLAPPDEVSIEEYRKTLASSRIESVGKNQVFLDRSGVGTGKSTSDVEAIKVAGRSLSVVPTHLACKETVQMSEQAGIHAAAYPRLGQELGAVGDADYEPPTCQNYEVAKQAIDIGLSASGAVCPTCSFSIDCEYQLQMARADGATHAICTHRRAELSFESMAKGRRYIAIHEDPTSLLRPVVEVARGLRAVAQVARFAKGEVWHDIQRRYFFEQLENAAHLVEGLLE